MMKRLVVLLICLIRICSASAEEPVKADAVVLEHEACFKMDSQSSGSLHVRTKTLVLNRYGLEAALFSVYTDSFKSLASFSGSMSNSGKIFRKLKKSDLVTVSAADGSVTDAYYTFYSPEAQYPFEVEYEYVVSYRDGFISFPAFLPVTGPSIQLRSASYTIDLPAGTEIQYNSTCEPLISSKGDRTLYRWDVPETDGYVSEHMMPSVTEFIPYVYAAPLEFEYASTKGCQWSWTEAGGWLYNLLLDIKKPSQEFKNKVLSLIEGVSDDKQKIKILYDYLKQHTRYVSVQLGIGGLKPYPTDYVDNNGFGDCKALSVYMQSMLSIAGIESHYMIMHTDRSRYVPGYYSVGQMNHAMLCVPCQNDTLYLECTNPRLPLGYRHDAVAGHDVLLVTDRGGELVSVPDYPDSLRFTAESVVVTLHGDGSASCSASRHLCLDAIEPYVSFPSLSSKEQFDVMMGGSSMNPSGFKVTSVEDDFDGWLHSQGTFVPEMKIGYAFDVKDYGKVTGDRLFIQLNPFAKQLYTERKERVNDYVRRVGRTVCDTIRVIVPPGYVVEALPSSDNVTSRFGCLEHDVRVIDDVPGKSIEIVAVQKLTLYKCRERSETYPEYRTFARNVSKTYSSRIVLRKE